MPSDSALSLSGPVEAVPKAGELRCVPSPHSLPLALALVLVVLTPTAFAFPPVTIQQPALAARSAATAGVEL